MLSLHLSLLCLHMYRCGDGGALTARPLRTEEVFTVQLNGRPWLCFGVTTHRSVILMCYNSPTDIPVHTPTDVHVHTQTRTMCVVFKLASYQMYEGVAWYPLFAHACNLHEIYCVISMYDDVMFGYQSININVS